jgi:hypothetical protein
MNKNYTEILRSEGLLALLQRIESLKSKQIACFLIYFPIYALWVFNDLVISKAVPLHAMEAHGERGGIAPTHS